MALVFLSFSKWAGFNEAAGIHRRKRLRASVSLRAKSCFNEAAGIHRAETDFCISRVNILVMGFNEAAGIHRRNLGGKDQQELLATRMLQ